MNILQNLSPYMRLTLSQSESGERQEVSPQDIALRIQNTLRCVSIVISTERKVRINYSVAVNTVGRYTGTDPKQRAKTKAQRILPRFKAY